MDINTHHELGAGLKDGDVIPFTPHLLMPKTIANFPVYLKRGSKFVMYSRGGDSFGAGHRAQLASLGHEQVFIEASRKQDYDAYVVSNISGILTDETIPAKDRAETWSDTVCILVREFFEAHLPLAIKVEQYRHLERIVRNSKRFFSEPGALGKLAKFISKNNDEYHHGIGTMIFTACLMRTHTDNELLLMASGIGAILHDVGLMRLPKSIREKNPSEYDECEKAIYTAHPTLSVAMCAPIPLVPEAIETILLHHERMDGRGFPSGAMDTDIPLHGRAVALANAYDGLTRPQGWRPAYTPFQALSHIRDDPGGYDQDLFKRLVGLLAREDITTEIRTNT